MYAGRAHQGTKGRSEKEEGRGKSRGNTNNTNNTTPKVLQLKTQNRKRIRSARKATQTQKTKDAKDADAKDEKTKNSENELSFRPRGLEEDEADERDGVADDLEGRDLDAEDEHGGGDEEDVLCDLEKR